MKEKNQTNEKKQIAEYMSLINDVATSASSTSNLDDILQVALDRLAVFFEVEQSTVAFFDGLQESFIIRSEYCAKDCVSAIDLRIPLNRNRPFEKVQRTKRSLIVNDVLNDIDLKQFREAIGKNRILSMMIIPIIIDDEVVGIIGINAIREKKYFTAEDTNIVETVANQLALAMQKTQLVRDNKFHANALKLLHENRVDLISINQEARNLHDLLERIAISAQKVLQADIVDLYLYDQDQDEFSLPPVQVGERIDVEVVKGKIYKDDVIYTLLENVRPIYVQDTQRESTFITPYSKRKDAPNKRFVIREKIASTAAIPLLTREEIVGILFANFRTRQTFQVAQKEVIELFAQQAAIAIRNARQFQESLQKSARLDLVRKVAAEVSSSTDVEEIFQIAVEGLARVLDVKQSAVALFDPSGEFSTVKAEYLEPGYFPSLGKKIPLQDNRQIDEILNTKKAIIVPDVKKDKQLWDVLKERGTLSIMIVPIIVEDEVIGTIGIDAVDRPRNFTEEEANLAQAIANQSGAAIRIARQLDERVNDLRALQDITEQMLEGDMVAVIEMVAQRAVEITDATYGGVWLVNKSRATLEFCGLANKGQHKELPPDIPFGVDSENSISKWVVQNRQSYLTADVREDENYKPWWSDTLSELTVPVVFHDRVIGTINVESNQKNKFTIDQMHLLEAMAGQAAIVVQNAQLIERLNALDDIGVELTSGPHPQEKKILEAISTHVIQLTGAQDMFIALYNEESGEIRFPLATERGERVQYSPRKADMEERGKTEEIIFTKKPLLQKTQEEAKKWYEPPERSEFVGLIIPSWLGVPMIVGNRVLGVIAVYDLEQEFAYDEQDLQVFSAIASQAAFSLVNLELNRRNLALEALNDIGEKLTSGIRVQEDQILEFIFTTAQELTNAADLLIALYDESSGMIDFKLATEKGKWVKYPSRRANMEKRGKIEEIIYAREPILHKTLNEGKEWYAQPGHGEFVGIIQPSWLGVPMVAGERVLGVIAAVDLEKEFAYDEFHLEVLASMASQAAIALDNARLYETAREEVVAAKQLSTLGIAIAALQHRINNTFNIIIPNVTRLRSRVDMSDPTMVEILDIIERNARYTSSIIARIQEPLKEVGITDVNINAILDSVVLGQRELWKTGVTKPYINIEFEADENIPVIRGPSGQIADVFDNLLGNAYKAMPKGGKIRVVSELNDGIIYVRVMDSGFGIPEEKQERLFMKPVPSKEPGAGAGLGLWLSHLMLQSIGGNILVENSSKKGTTMLVTIPVPQAKRLASNE